MAAPSGMVGKISGEVKVSGSLEREGIAVSANAKGAANPRSMTQHLASMLKEK